MRRKTTGNMKKHDWKNSQGSTEEVAGKQRSGTGTGGIPTVIKRFKCAPISPRNEKQHNRKQIKNTQNKSMGLEWLQSRIESLQLVRFFDAQLFYLGISEEMLFDSAQSSTCNTWMVSRDSADAVNSQSAFFHFWSSAMTPTWTTAETTKRTVSPTRWLSWRSTSTMSWTMSCPSTTKRKTS